MTESTMTDQTDAQILEAHAAGTRGYKLPDGSCTRSAERCIASWRAGAVVASTRGRPPGSKNKPKAARETLVDEPQAPQASVVLPEVVQASSDDAGETLGLTLDALTLVVETLLSAQEQTCARLRHLLQRLADV
jgi:hypothetical protein